MQTVKKLFMFMAIFLLSVSLVFAAMTTAQIKEKLEQGLPISEVLELALISGSTLADVYDAAVTATVPDDSSVDQIKAQITVAAIAIVSAPTTGLALPTGLSTLSMNDVVEASFWAGVPLTVVMAAAPSPEAKASVATAAIAMATPVVAADGTESVPVISVQDVAVAMLATGTSETVLSTALRDAGATAEQVDTVDRTAAFTQAVTEHSNADLLAPAVMQPYPELEWLQPEPPSQEPPSQEYDTSVSPT